MKCWEPVDLIPGKAVKRTIGDLEMRVTLDENRWNVAHRHKARGLLRSDFDITRVHPREGSSSVVTVPMMPDRPVVVDFGNPVRIVSGYTVRFLVPIPLWVGLMDPMDSGQILMEIPSVVLSNTWFGDHFSGTLSYSLKTHPIITQGEWIPTGHEALCPVEVRMESEKIFSFRKICLYAQYLTLYRKDDVFWTEGVVVEYLEESSMKITLSEKKPSLKQGFATVTEPRHRIDRNIFEKSMTVLRRYTGL